MCAIVDMNAVGDLFAASTKSEFKPFFDWLLGDGCVVYGGSKYRGELRKADKLYRLFMELKKTRRARESDDTKIDAEQQRIEHECSSDDPHIIALARVSGARILVLRADRKLEQDFQTRKLVANPRGRIYKNKSHWRLLRHDSSCRSR